MTNKLLIWAKLPKGDKGGFISLSHGINPIAIIWAKSHYVEKDSVTGKFRLMTDEGQTLLYVDLIKDFDGKILYTNQVKMKGG
jgi:hypothetical protein